MSTLCKIQVAGFLSKCFLCHGNNRAIGPYCQAVLFMRGSERGTAPPRFLCLLDARASDRKLDVAAAALHSSVVKIERRSSARTASLLVSSPID